MVTPTNKPASGHAHYRETCTRCVDKDKEISKLKLELQKATAVKTAAVKVVAAVIGIGIMTPFLLIAWATAMAQGNAFLISLTVICAPCMGIYFLAKLTES